MEPVMFVMAILGCGEGDAACREVRIEPRQYQSEVACLADTEAVLMRSDDLAYPSVVAQCRRADAAAQLLRGSEVALPEATLPQRAPQIADSRQPRRGD